MKKTRQAKLIHLHPTKQILSGFWICTKSDIDNEPEKYFHVEWFYIESRITSIYLVKNIKYSKLISTTFILTPEKSLQI